MVLQKSCVYSWVESGWGGWLFKWVAPWSSHLIMKPQKQGRINKKNFAYDVHQHLERKSVTSPLPGTRAKPINKTQVSEYTIMNTLLSNTNLSSYKSGPHYILSRKRSHELQFTTSEKDLLRDPKQLLQRLFPETDALLSHRKDNQKGHQNLSPNRRNTDPVPEL